MKVITEERLREIVSKNSVLTTAELNTLLTGLQQLDTLTKRSGETALEKFRRMEYECKELIDETPIERLRFFVSLMCDINQDSQSWSDIEFLFDECINTDTLTVKRLRPMREAPRDGEYFLVYCQTPGFINGTFFTYKYDAEIEDFIDEDENLMAREVVKGWIPMPKYEPEK